MPKEKGKFILPTSNHLKALKRVLPYFGTQAAIALALGISRQKVNDWFRGRDIIKSEYAHMIERMLQERVTFYELRPDLKIIANKACKATRIDV